MVKIEKIHKKRKAIFRSGKKGEDGDEHTIHDEAKPFALL